MNHDLDHCTGDYFNPDDALDMEVKTCKMRDTCQRYLAAQALKRGGESLPEGYAVYFLPADVCIQNNHKHYINGTE